MTTARGKDKLIPYDTSVEAEYSDGFVLSETEHGDASPYIEGKNVLNDIIEKRAEAEHGPMVRFSCFWKNNRYDVDWTILPDNARPIRFRDGQKSMNMATGEAHFNWVGLHFGYQYNNENGQNVKEVVDL